MRCCASRRRRRSTGRRTWSASSTDRVLRPLELVALPGGKGVNAARAAVRLGGQRHHHRHRRRPRRALDRGGAGCRGPCAAMVVGRCRVAHDLRDGGPFRRRRSSSTSGRGRRARRSSPPSCGYWRTTCCHARAAPSSPAASPPVSTRASHAAIVEVCRRAGCPLLVDASGPGLLAALAARPDVVKIGRIEAVEAGLVAPEASGAETAAALVDQGAALAVVTDGAEEVAAADATTSWRASVPTVDGAQPGRLRRCLQCRLLAGADGGHIDGDGPRTRRCRRFGQRACARGGHARRCCRTPAGEPGERHEHEEVRRGSIDWSQHHRHRRHRHRGGIGRALRRRGRPGGRHLPHRGQLPCSRRRDRRRRGPGRTA